jgi:uncharacterized membrane protein YkvI
MKVGIGASAIVFTQQLSLPLMMSFLVFILVSSVVKTRKLTRDGL